mgnify:CR=1 FL=1
MIKLGFVSAILADLSFEEVVDFAANNGYSCVEILCWPKGKAERRYAGVTHIDVNELDEKRINSIKKYLEEKKIEISALGYYPDQEKRKFYIEHLKKVITAAAKLGLKNVNTFIGKDKNKNIEDNFKTFKKTWPAIVKHAQENKVKIGIENCPMYFTNDEWPGGNNLATSPAIWRRMFEEIKSDYFGLNYDPSHLLWQYIDYIKPIYEFKNKIFHVHIKDAKIFQDQLYEVGILAPPLEYHSPKLPGLGDINWGKFISALTDIKYHGCACVEVEDRSFEDSLESRKKSLILSRQFLNQFIVSI